MSEPENPMEWRMRGRCADTDPELFFPDNAAQMTQYEWAAVNAICGACPVFAQCREYAVAHEEEGIWAGMSPSARRRERRGRAHRGQGAVVVPLTVRDAA